MVSNLSQANSKIDIITIGCEDHLQKRNVLKGLALQKLVKQVMHKSDEDITIRKIFDSLTEQQEEYFIISKPFKTQNNRYFKRWRFIHLSDFDDYLEIWIREQQITKEWKICNHCGQKIRASEQFSRKCWKCKKGWYKVIITKKDKWRLQLKGDKSRAINFLQKEGFLKVVRLKKRLDFFHYNNGVFSIFEAKNKEKTGLTVGDLHKTMIYPYIVTRCGFTVSKLIMIYNGKITKTLDRELRRGFNAELPFDIELVSIGKFLTINDFSIQGVKVSKRDNEYVYEIIPGNSNKIFIDLTAV